MTWSSEALGLDWAGRPKIQASSFLLFKPYFALVVPLKFPMFWAHESQATDEGLALRYLFIYLFYVTLLLVCASIFSNL